MGRPECNAKSPDLNNEQGILKQLLEVELRRLAVAEGIEKERNIVFPETSVIIRDICKLNSAINGKTKTDNIEAKGIIGYDLLEDI